MAMTSEAKRALSQTIRKLRQRLLDDLREATEGTYRLSIDAGKARLSEANRIRRQRLEIWVAEQVRPLPEKSRPAAAVRAHADVIKDAAATLLQRLVYLRLLEAAKLRPVAVVTGGWDSRGYKDFREAAPELVQPERPGRTGDLRDETEGYAALLRLVFDELALDLPGLYGPVRMTSLVPVPAATLRAVITALDDDALTTVWTDDTTLGWIYQYWNDPEREALDAKLAASKKLENHEIASKTQMFTERYMVEWLLHNSLGQMWLAMCKKHGWTADFERDLGSGSVRDRLEARRIDWRAKRDAGEVALDALMLIEPGLEDRWKYWVPQPMPDDAVTLAPDSVQGLKLLDPACGSGHFLVIAFELLFFLYQEEARHRGESPRLDGDPWSPRWIVESIVEHNLYGLDIDPRAIQIAAAALMLKARLLCPDAEPRTLNLVAPNLSLASLAEDDPALVALYTAVEHETGIPPELTRRIVGALAGADHLGTLLKVDTEIDAAIDDWDAQLSQPVGDQGELFSGFGPRRRKRITAEHARATLLSRLEGFLDHHTRGADLGLRLRGEQLAAGVRFVRMVREGQYDLVVGNPPYQGTSKMADKAYFEKHYPRGKADLYACFLERGLQLARNGGVSALITMRNWMFLSQFYELRSWLLKEKSLRCLADLGTGAFSSRSMDDFISAACSIIQTTSPIAISAVAIQAAPLADQTRDAGKPLRRTAALLAQSGRFDFLVSAIIGLPLYPVIYWWSEDELAVYAAAPKLGAVAPVRMGISTSDNVRFLRQVWELSPGDVVSISGNMYEYDHPGWRPLISGAAGVAWIAPLDQMVNWKLQGLELEMYPAAVLRNPSVYMKGGIAFTPMGSSFSARAHRYRSMFDAVGRSVIPDDVPEILAAMNTSRARSVIADLNPSITFTVGDVERMPLFPQPRARDIINMLSRSFTEHETHREPSVEFRKPGASNWNYFQSWAQLAVDNDEGSLPPLPQAVFVTAPATVHLSFAVGTILGRFGNDGEGVLKKAPLTALPHGLLFLSDAADYDSLSQSTAAPLLRAWQQHGTAIDDKRTLKNYLQDRFFPDVHRKMYENRPIYFPLSSAKKSFVAYVSIHRWTSSTLNDLLAEHLYPAKRRLEGEQADLRPARDSADKKAAKEAEKRLGQVAAWLEELTDFIAKVEQCAEKGPPPPDGKTTPREVDARYEMDLDDGVMVNSAALWPLLEPQWKDPKKWWKELANAEGKKDYDWAHLARRYFPTRVDAKCQVDPSLGVAHGCFWKYHPDKAYQWELRLKDEIRPDFTLDEPGSDAARAAFEAADPAQVKKLVAKELERRARKQAKAGQADATEDDAQGDLDLADPDAEDADADAGEELSA